MRLFLVFLIYALIGEYVPQRFNNGSLLPRQCWGSTGMCWCEFAETKEYFRMTDLRDCPKESI